MKPITLKHSVRRLLPVLGMAAALSVPSVRAHEAEPIPFSPIGIPYAWLIELEADEVTATEPAHVGAWSWDEDGFPSTAKGWTHTSAWVKLDLAEPVNLTLTLESLSGVPWPSAEEPGRLAGTNLFPSVTLYRGWDTDAGVLTNADGTTLDQDHTFNNRGDIAWAEDVTYLDHAENSVEHSLTRTWTLPAGHYTVNLGGNSPATVAEGRQGYRAIFGTTAASTSVTNAVLSAIEFDPVGIPYAFALTMDDQASAETTPSHVGAWSWDEDGFPATARGWTHTSAWVKLRLTKPALLTLNLASLEGVPWPSAEEPARLAGTNLYPSFTIYSGWDTDAGLLVNTDGTTLDQDHTFNNRGNIAWAEDVTYLNHLENATEHQATRTWLLAAGEYTVNLGGNSPATIAEGRQGYRATFTTAPAPVNVANAALTPVEFNPVGIPYGWEVTLGADSTVQTLPDHVGAWSWDEDGFPATARGWTHTSKFVKLNLTQPALLTLVLESLGGVEWPSAEEPARLAGTNLFPSFTIYSGWDTDAGVVTNSDGTTLDQDHTFNNRGNIEWAEDVTFLDYLENADLHKVSRTWTLPAGSYTINLGGNSPALVAEGRQGYRAVFTTVPATAPATNAVVSSVEFSPIGIPYAWKVVLGDTSSATTAPDFVGAWSWDEDGFPATSKGWTHTSRWAQVALLQPAALGVFGLLLLAGDATFLGEAGVLDGLHALALGLLGCDPLRFDPAGLGALAFILGPLALQFGTLGGQCSSLVSKPLRLLLAGQRFVVQGLQPGDALRPHRLGLHHELLERFVDYDRPQVADVLGDQGRLHRQARVPAQLCDALLNASHALALGFDLGLALGFLAGLLGLDLVVVVRLAFEQPRFKRLGERVDLPPDAQHRRLRGLAGGLCRNPWRTPCGSAGNGLPHARSRSDIARHVFRVCGLECGKSGGDLVELDDRGLDGGDAGFYCSGIGSIDLVSEFGHGWFLVVAKGRDRRRTRCGPRFGLEGHAAQVFVGGLAGLGGLLLAEQRHVAHVEGDVRLALVLADAQFAGNADAVALVDHLGQLCATVAEHRAVKPDGLLALAVARVDRHRPAAEHLPGADFTGLAIAADSADELTRVHAASFLSVRMSIHSPTFFSSR